MSMLTALAAMVAIAGPTDALDLPNRAPLAVASQQAQPSDGTRLEDVVVEGRSLTQTIRNFVEGVAEPNGQRGLARWESRVCVAVFGLQREGAEYIADRVSTVASDLGIAVGAPGCSPNLVVIATTDGNSTARDLVQERRYAFNLGSASTNRSRLALHDFQENERPVRWWQVSMPVDSTTGERAIRLPGDCDDANCSPPVTRMTSASRLRTQVVDNMRHAIVIVDVDQIAHLSALRLADYIAMVSLAQVDPDADTADYASILNVMSDPQGSPSLTDWDQAYLTGLYSAERHYLNRMAGRNEIVTAVRKERQNLRDQDDRE